MPNWHLSDVIESIPDLVRQLDLSNAIHLVGGWRGLFDPYCSEWDAASVEDKVEVLDRILQETGLSLTLIVRAFQEDYWKERPDIARTAPDALCILLEAS